MVITSMSMPSLLDDMVFYPGVYYGARICPRTFLRSFRSFLAQVDRTFIGRFVFQGRFSIETPRRRTVNNNFTRRFAPNAHHVGYSLAIRVKSVHATGLRVCGFRHDSQDKNQLLWFRPLLRFFSLRMLTAWTLEKKETRLTARAEILVPFPRLDRQFVWNNEASK